MVSIIELILESFATQHMDLLQAYTLMYITIVPLVTYAFIICFGRYIPTKHVLYISTTACAIFCTSIWFWIYLLKTIDYPGADCGGFYTYPTNPSKHLVYSRIHSYAEGLDKNISKILLIYMFTQLYAMLSLHIYGWRGLMRLRI